jgi:hypothetical protein
MSKEYSLSILISGLGRSREEVVLDLVDVDNYLSNLRYSSYEILVVDDGSLDIGKTVDNFDDFLPSVLEVSEENILSNISGERVLVINNFNDVSFDDFEEMIDVSKSDFDMAFIKGRERVFLEKVTQIFKKVLKIKPEIKVVSNFGLAYFDPHVLGEVSLFNFSSVCITGVLKGYSVKVLDNEDGLKLKFSNYGCVWKHLISYWFNNLIKKIWRK